MRGINPRLSSALANCILAIAALSLAALVGVAQAVPFTSATVTRVENRVNYGERRDGRSATRAASVSDVIRANQFLLSEANSRAELQYPDGSLVRIGQNTVFSFDAESRTLSLEEGSLLFHIPKGSGGGTIKTPTLTAAITGTTGKVSRNYIAIIEGTVRLVPSGRIISTGQFARRNLDRTITVGNFDPASANDGRLVNWNGKMRGFERQRIPGTAQLTTPDLRELEVLHRTQNLPGSITHFFPEPKVDRPRKTTKAPPRRNTAPDNDDGNY